MALYQLWVMALALAMDAFAVSICQGFGMDRFRPGRCCIIALYFGGFQALMPLVGWLVGRTIAGPLQALDHWVAFFLLVAIGLHMLREALGRDSGEPQTYPWRHRTLLLLAIATSLDALTVGVALACLEVSLAAAIATIGLVTCGICGIGVMVGWRFGDGLGRHAGAWGGVVLIAIGGKILLEHLTRHI